jgi:hypothetical protein
VPNTYLAGSLVRVATYTGPVGNPTGGFRDENGDLADPTTVVLEYREGLGGSLVTVTYPASPLVKDGTGLYHADLDTTGSPEAPWEYALIGIGAVQAVASNVFIVRLLI